jgi:hypothetical protein
MTVKITQRLLDEARAYYKLCDQARRQGVPVSLDDPASSSTVKALVEAVQATK